MPPTSQTEKQTNKPVNKTHSHTVRQPQTRCLNLRVAIWA